MAQAKSYTAKTQGLKVIIPEKDGKKFGFPVDNPDEELKKALGNNDGLWFRTKQPIITTDDETAQKIIEATKQFKKGEIFRCYSPAELEEIEKKKKQEKAKETLLKVPIDFNALTEAQAAQIAEEIGCEASVDAVKKALGVKPTPGPSQEGKAKKPTPGPSQEGKAAAKG